MFRVCKAWRHIIFFIKVFRSFRLIFHMVRKKRGNAMSREGVLLFESAPLFEIKVAFGSNLFFCSSLHYRKYV